MVSVSLINSSLVLQYEDEEKDVVIDKLRTTVTDEKFLKSAEAIASIQNRTLKKVIRRNRTDLF